MAATERELSLSARWHMSRLRDFQDKLQKMHRPDQIRLMNEYIQREQKIIHDIWAELDERFPHPPMSDWDDGSKPLYREDY